MKIYSLLAAFTIGTGSLQAGPDDSSIRDEILTQLNEFEPTSSVEAEISVAEGIVSLTGYAENLPAKLYAAEVSEKVRGVRAIVNRIEVRETEREDETIEADIKQLFTLNRATGNTAVSLKVNDGVVTLTGQVSSPDVSTLSELMASSINGVRDVVNLIRIEPEKSASDEEISQHLALLLRGDPWVESKLVKISVVDGTVELHGSVDSMSERSRLEEMAKLYGVRKVVTENLEVSPSLRAKMERPHAPIFESDEELKLALESALQLDPRVLADNVDVNLLDGDATLIGQVDSIGAKAAAEANARNVPGIELVYSYLSVDTSNEIPDDQLQTAISAIMKADSLLSGASIEPIVKDHVVELKGEVLSEYQRRRALTIAAHSTGVSKVVSKLRIDWDSDETTSAN